MDTRQMVQLFGSFFSSQVQPVFKHYLEHQEQTVDIKGTGTERVAQIDREIDQIYMQFLGHHFPDDVIVSEERPSIWLAHKDMWVVDPCDGTHNFLSDVPAFGSTCTHIQGGIPTFAAILLPVREITRGRGYCFAIRGQGAWERTPQKASPLHVSNTARIEESQLLYEGPKKKLLASPIAQHLKERSRRYHTCSATSLAGVLVASGGNAREGFDGLITVENKFWDNLPVALLIEEAGGKVTDGDGNPYTIERCSNLVMSNGHIHQQILDTIREIPIF